MHKTEDDLQQLQQRWEQKPPPHGALTAAPEASRSLTAQRAVRSPWFRQTCLSSPQLTRTPAAHTPVPFKPFISPPRWHHVEPKMKRQNVENKNKADFI